MQHVDYVIMGAVALILLLGGLLFLPSGPTEFTLNSAHLEGCNQLKMKYSCDQYAVAEISVFTTGNFVYSLGNICASKGFDNTLTCARSCGCNISGQTAALYETPSPKIEGGLPLTRGIVPEDPETEEEEVIGDYYGV